MLVQLPSSPDIPILPGVTIALAGSVAIRNLGLSASLDPAVISVYAAPPDAPDVYATGTPLVSLPSASIPPGGETEAVFGFELSEGSSYASILEQGKLRLGLSLSFTDSGGTTVSVGVELTKIEITIAGRPFLLIP